MFDGKVAVLWIRPMFHRVRQMAVRPASLAKDLFAGFLSYYQRAPLLIKAVFWAVLIWGPGLSLPSLLSNFRQATPPGIPDQIIIGLHLPLGTVPVLIMWLWFPNASVTFGQQMKKVISMQSFKELDIKQPWHLPASVAIAGVSIIPFVVGLASDDIIEWFEVTTPFNWGWGVLVLLVGVQVVIAVLTAFRMLTFFRWFTSNIRSRLNLEPIHPDGCGGMGFVGAMIWRLTVFAVLIGIWSLYTLVTSYYRNSGGLSLMEMSPGLILNAVILLVAVQSLSFAFLVVPTFITHKAMVRERDRYLENLHDHLLDAAPSLKTAMISDGLLILKNFPTLPFTSGQLRVLSGLSAMPTYLSAVPPILEFLRG